jgi:hypothetical protein
MGFSRDMFCQHFGLLIAFHFVYKGLWSHAREGEWHTHLVRNHQEVARLHSSLQYQTREVTTVVGLRTAETGEVGLHGRGRGHDTGDSSADLEQIRVAVAHEQPKLSKVTGPSFQLHSKVRPRGPSPGQLAPLREDGVDPLLRHLGPVTREWYVILVRQKIRSKRCPILSS